MNTIEYTLVRSRRKTVAIHVIDGGVEVRAPLKLPRREIDGFVVSKARWIADRLAASRERAEHRAAFTLDYGGRITVRGTERVIEPREGRRAGFDGDTVFMPPGLSHEQIKAVCVRLYRMLAKTHLSERAEFFARIMRAEDYAIRVSGARTRWGSCSGRRNLSFSWRLMMTDDDLIDYVVVHELAHLCEMNHSPRFWAIVEGVLPDYRVLRRRLRAYQKKISAEDWD